MARIKPSADIQFLTDKLYDAVQDFVNDGNTMPTSCILVLPSGKSFDLNTDFRIPDINVDWISLNGFKIPLPDIDIEVSLMGTMVALTDFPIPTTQNWYYKRNGQPHQLGTAYSPVEYYMFSDAMFDATIFLSIIVIIFLISKIGLAKLAAYFVKAAMFSTSHLPATEFEGLVTDVTNLTSDVATVSNNVNTVNNNMGAVAGKTLAAMISKMHFGVEITDTAQLTGTEDEIHEIVEQIKSDFDIWQTYLDEYTLWLQNPHAFNKPTRPF